MSKRIAIIGAGISGLSTVFYLKRVRPDWDLVIYDAAREAGGTMQTVEIKGYRFEAGGNGFLSNKPDSLQLVEDAGAGHLLLTSSDLARKRFVFTDRMHRLPESPPLFLKTRLIGWKAKLRVAGEVFVRARKSDGEETLQEFGYRRLGREFTDVFLDAMVAGIYATTPDRISVAAAFPLVVALERDHGGLFRGMLAKRKRQAGPGGVLTSFSAGVSTLIAHLYECIDAEWRLGTAVTAVDKSAASFRVSTASAVDEFDEVVIATPSHVAAKLLGPVDDTLSSRLAAIEYSPVAVVGLGYRDLDHPLDGFGLLTTSRAKMPILGVLWDSSIFTDRAPPGGKVLRAIIGGQRNPELVEQGEAALVDTARRGILATMGIDKDPEVTFVKRWPRGIPSYAPGHIDRVAAIFEQLVAHPGLHLTGNAYRGIAMNDCVRQGRLLARQIAACDE